MKTNQYLLLILLLAISIYSKAQEKVCIPNVWSPETVKGTIYLTNGDSLKGKFLHLTPYNDIKTTHIIYKSNAGPVNVNRQEIKAYFDKKKNEYRIKVYINRDSIHMKKGCVFDQGRFLLVIDKGKYTLLKDELNYYSSIDAYSQSNQDDIYYILPPNKKLIKVQINNLRAQMISLFSEDEVLKYLSDDRELTVVEMIELIEGVNVDDQPKR